MSRWALYIAFFLSGLSGLIYQVVWVRFFGNAFGNTVQSAALVTSVFMLGLGIGSLAAGAWIDRRQSAKTPLVAYAIAEALIAGWGLALAALLPRLGDLAAMTASYSVGADGWHHVSAGSYVSIALLAVVLLLPVTTVMGGTLTLLIRHVLQSDLSNSGWRVGLLYGVNTGGAALGAFATDFALVPVLGLFATAGCAALANLGAALIAMRLTKQVVGADIPVAAPQPWGRPNRRTLLVAGAVAASGFAAMGFEMAWFRFFNITLGGYRAIFSLLLATVLAAMWLGAVVGGALHRRYGRPGTLFMASQGAVVLFTLALLALPEPGSLANYPGMFADYYLNAGEMTRAALVAVAELRQIGAVVAVPAFLMGFAYPLSNAMVQEDVESIGRTAGGLYLANTVGAVAGSVVTGFVLIPTIGTQSSILVLAVVATLSILLIAGASRREGRRGAVPALAVAIVAVGGWLALPADRLIRHTTAHLGEESQVLAISEGPNEVVVVSEEGAQGARRLNTNGHSMSATTTDALRYMRLFSHFPLLHLDAPESVLVICFGVGNTVHAASLHPVKSIEIADLSSNVLRHASYFSKWNQNVLNDSRTHVFIQDGRSHLRTRDEGTYDLVTLEPPPLGFAGVSSLYSREFYELARGRLKDGGFVTQWLPAYQVPGTTVLSIIRAFQDVFPDAILLLGAGSELILVGRKGAPLQIRLDDLIRRLAERPEVTEDLQRIQVGPLVDFIALYGASSETLKKATADVLPVTDDYPILEYSRTSTVIDYAIPGTIFSPYGVKQWCTDCWPPTGPPDPRLDGINAYLTLMYRFTQSPGFRIHSSIRAVQQTPIEFPTGVTPASPLIRDSLLLRDMFPEPEAAPVVPSVAP